MKRIALAAAVIGLAASAARAETFSIDPMHSSVGFTIRHVVGNVTGRFDKFSGSFIYDPKNVAGFTCQATIDPHSINTGVTKRDDDLRSPHFFDVDKYNEMVFKSTGLSDVQGNKAKLNGTLTMHGVTKPVVLDLELLGVVKNPMGPGNRAGASAHGTVNRNDFGIGPSSGPMAGAIGDQVTITIDVEGVSKP